MCCYKPVNLGSSAGLDKVIACQGNRKQHCVSDAGVLIPPQYQLPRHEGQPCQHGHTSRLRMPATLHLSILALPTAALHAANAASPLKGR